MLRAALLAVGLAGALGLAGCGRLGFGDSTSHDAGDAGDANDTPPVPASICGVDRLPLTGLPAAADLAITGTSEGYAAIWVDTAGGAPAHGVLLGPNRSLAASLAMPDVKDSRLGGVADAGQKLVLSSGSATAQTTWIVGRDLATASPGAPQTDYVVAHGPYPSDTAQAPRLFVSATGKTVSAAYLGDDGIINTASTVNRGTTGNVTDVACADGPNHSHCAYAEALASPNGASQCSATDVLLMPVPNVTGGPVVSADCYSVRVSSGPDVADSMIVVWNTADHRVEARYVGGGGVDTMIHDVGAGSAPKVQFDGTRFWIAWLDASGVLQLSSFDLNSRIVSYPLPGWVPLGAEAFELVRRGNETGLVLLSRAGLEFLSICS